MSNSDESDTMLKLTPRKKPRRMCIFLDKWLTDETYLSWLHKHSESDAYCSFFRFTFTIKYEGILALKKHQNSEKHEKSICVVKQNKIVSNFFVSKIVMKKKL